MKKNENTQVIVTTDIDLPDGKKTIEMELKQSRLIQDCDEGKVVFIELKNGDKYTGIFKGIDEDDDYTIMLESLSGKNRIGLRYNWIKQYYEEIGDKNDM